MNKKLVRKSLLIMVVLMGGLLGYGLQGDIASSGEPGGLNLVLPSPSGSEGFVRDHILVKFKPTANIKAINFALGAKTLEVIPEIDVHITRIPKAVKAEEMIRRFRENPNVAYAELDYIAYAIGIPDDPNFNKQWGLNNTGQTGGTSDADIDAPEAWDKTTGNPIIKIAILDTGIDQDHEDLGKIATNKNFTTSSTVDDNYGHGTHVAGIAAAATNNGIGIAGTGYNSNLMNGKVLNDKGSGNYSWIANGIIWAANSGAKVINMSLGGLASSITLRDAVNYAWGKGVVLTAAAGNNGSKVKVYPAAYPNCIAVAATDDKDSKASWSNYGTNWVDVAAPGVNIYSTLPNHPNTIGPTNYSYLDGTSMAAPFVAGIAALVWTTSYGTNNSSVRNKIESTADNIPGTGTYWKYGRINAFSAVK